MNYDILVVDDEADIRDLVCDVLKDEGYTTRKAHDSFSVFEAFNDKVPSLVLLDIWLQGSELDGLGILEILKKKYPIVPVIMISGHGTISTAVSSLKLGAYDYIEKPFSEDKLIFTVKRACEMFSLIRENASLKMKYKSKIELIGNSQAIQNLKSSIEKIAPTSSRVLIIGEIGSGKELIANMIHKKSKRFNDVFVSYCPTGVIAEKVMQDLFGESKEQNINDVPRKMGCLEVANHGTLFIDEIADLPMPVQNKLLRFLQDQNFEKANGKTIKLDVRLIASSSKDLQHEIALGRFKQDLFYRLNVATIKSPSLTERKEDIPILSNYFMKYLENYIGLPAKIFSEEAIIVMQSYNWPGNVRQLKNLVEWLLIMNRNENTVKANMLPPEIISSCSGITKNDDMFDLMSLTLREAREIFEKQYLSAQMNRFNGNISKTSAFVGMERSALHRKLKSLNINSNNNLEDTESQEISI